MMPRIMIALFLFVLAISPNVRADEDMLPQKKLLIKDLLRVQNSSTMATKMVETSLENMQKTTLPQMIDAALKQQYTVDQLAAVSEEQRDAIIRKYSARMVERMRTEIFEKLDIAGITENVWFSLYGKYFDEKELQEIMDFYKSPTGAKVVTLSPQLSAEAVKMTGEATNKVVINAYLKTTKEEMAALIAELFPIECEDEDAGDE